MKHNECKRKKGISQRSIYLLLFAALVYLVAAYLGFFAPDADGKTVSVFVAVATAMVAVALVRAWQENRGEVLVDERTRLVQRVAVGYSWWFSYVLIAILLLANQFGGIRFEAENALSLVFFAMIASLIFFRFYLSRKEDLE